MTTWLPLNICTNPSIQGDRQADPPMINSAGNILKTWQMSWQLWLFNDSSDIFRIFFNERLENCIHKLVWAVVWIPPFSIKNRRKRSHYVNSYVFHQVDNSGGVMSHRGSLTTVNTLLKSWTSNSGESFKQWTWIYFIYIMHQHF